MEPKVIIFPTPYELAKGFAEEMVRLINESIKINKTYTIALSGGSTPGILFNVLAENFAGSVPWQHVHFFWGDERCVPPDNPESNFRMTNEKLLGKIKIPELNIHRIKGENDPETEALRYSEEIGTSTRDRHGLPLFDLILLGLGEDGHTASIFPGQLGLFDSDKTCAVASHPLTLQKRITLTGKVINNADAVTFLVNGEEKAVVVEKLFKKDPSASNYPASFVVPVYGRLTWFLDKGAGRLL